MLNSSDKNITQNFSFPLARMKVKLKKKIAIFLYQNSNSNATISMTYFVKEPWWLLSLWRRRVPHTK